LLTNADTERKDLLNQLKSNFKFIEGFKIKHPIRDEKGVLLNKEWRVDVNIEKKILKPTSIINFCEG